MAASPSGEDPRPDAPAGLLDAARIPKLAREIGRAAAAGGDEPGEGPAPPPEANAAYEPPEVRGREVVASCRPWPAFAVMVAHAVWAAGFRKAGRKAFVAGGSANNWRLRGRSIGSFEPILDFIHASSYVYAGAAAGRSPDAGWVWRGQVAKVIEEPQRRQEEVGVPQGGESETSVRSVVARARVYLSNHRDKRRYDQYRKRGCRSPAA